jgi:hypothetical protein
MNRVLSVKLTIRAPFITGNGEVADLARDALMLRDNNNHVMFPRTQIKGLLYDSLTSMAAMASDGLCGLSAAKTSLLMETIFGRKSSADTDDVGGSFSAFELYAPHRGKAVFSDLLSEKSYDPAKSDTKTRIERDDLTGSTVEGSLQTVEMIGEHGSPINFVMTITLPEITSEIAVDIANLVDLGFAPLTSIGGSKTAGFGRIATRPEVELLAVETEPSTQNVFPDDAHEFVGTLRFNGALMIDASRAADNAFVSSDVVPGAAIKAAIADALAVEPSSTDGLALASLRITHATPKLVGSHETHTALPLSVALFRKGSDELVADMAMEKQPILMESDGLVPPRFAVDWKSTDTETVIKNIDRKLGVCALTASKPKLVRKLQVRTAIDKESGAALQEEQGGQLFSYETVLPVDESGNEIEWSFRVSGVESACGRRLLADAGATGLTIGKLKTSADIHLQQSFKVSPSIVPHLMRDGRSYFTLTLQTPAVMFEMHEASTGELSELYSSYFRDAFAGSEIDPDDLKLENFFSEQELRGGYQALRFTGGRDFYAPWVLTIKGSIFVFSVANELFEKCSSRLAEFQTSGLPVASTVAEPDWKHCPFVPENGYGACVINLLPAHWRSSEEQVLLKFSDERIRSC